MTTYLWLISVCSTLLIIIIFAPIDKWANLSKQKRIYKTINQSKGNKSTYSGFLGSLVFKIAERLYYVLGGKSDFAKKEHIQKQLASAGISKTVSFEVFWGLKYLSAIVVFLIYFPICILYKFQTNYILLLLVAVLAGYIVPDYMIKQRQRVRREKMNCELPNLLNTLAIMTDAGLSLNEALRKISEDREGIISTEIRQVMEDVDMGSSQQNAFMKSTERCDTEQYRNFVFSLCQSIEKGSSGIAEDLKKLAAETWEQRKNKAREAGSKASTKLLFPMMLFSFPALFILILGPAFISMMRIW